MECTVSTEDGRTWREYQQGTRSRIVLPCPYLPPVGHAGARAPDRLAGGATTRSRPAHPVSSPARPAASAGRRRTAPRPTPAVILLHRDQTLTDDGSVEGEPPATDTLGFRWSAVNNLFVTAGDMAADEWVRAAPLDEENAEREMRQFVWCLPVAAHRSGTRVSLVAHEIARPVIVTPAWRRADRPKCVTAAIDLGKYLCALDRRRPGSRRDWVTSWTTAGSKSPARTWVWSRRLLVALRQFKDMVLAGWPEVA